jgi:hypothetical protein
MEVTDKKRRIVKLSQKQQARFGYEWHGAKFITVHAMDLKP